MTKGLVSQEYLTATANAIRRKLGVQDTYLPSEFADAIASITGGGGGDTFAFIVALNFPNAPLVSKDGQYIYPVNDASEQEDNHRYVYPIPTPDELPDEWNIEASEVAFSKNIEIIKQGQSINVSSMTREQARSLCSPSGGFLLSDNSGDYLLLNGRKFTRSSNEVILFINIYNSASSYPCSYGAITLSETPPAGTGGDQWGELTYRGPYTTPNGTVCHIHGMRGTWGSSYKDTTYRVNGSDKTVTTVVNGSRLYIDKSGDNWIIKGSSANLDIIHSIIDCMAYL